MGFLPNFFTSSFCSIPFFSTADIASHSSSIGDHRLLASPAATTPTATTQQAARRHRGHPLQRRRRHQQFYSFTSTTASTSATASTDSTSTASSDSPTSAISRRHQQFHGDIDSFLDNFTATSTAISRRHQQFNADSFLGFAIAPTGSVCNAVITVNGKKEVVEVAMDEKKEKKKRLKSSSEDPKVKDSFLDIFQPFLRFSQSSNDDSVKEDDSSLKHVTNDSKNVETEVGEISGSMKEDEVSSDPKEDAGSDDIGVKICCEQQLCILHPSI
ncbi:hypothetical protein LXL04_027854 [Taraxacum kok-saghyz]